MASIRTTALRVYPLQQPAFMSESRREVGGVSGPQGSLCFCIGLVCRVPVSHPLRKQRTLVDVVPASIDGESDAICVSEGRTPGLQCARRLNRRGVRVKGSVNLIVAWCATC